MVRLLGVAVMGNWVLVDGFGLIGGWDQAIRFGRRRGLWVCCHPGQLALFLMVFTITASWLV